MAGEVTVIAKLAPQGDAFTGLVDARQVIGDGATNVVPNNAISSGSVLQHISGTQVTGSDSFFTNTTLDSRGKVVNTTGFIILSGNTHISGTLTADAGITVDVTGAGNFFIDSELDSRGKIKNTLGQIILSGNSYITGNLVVSDIFSASSYQGLPTHIDTQVTGSSYFFVTNDLAVSGTLSASSYLGLPAHIDTQVTGSDSFFTTGNTDVQGKLINTTGYVILSGNTHISGTLTADAGITVNVTGSDTYFVDSTFDARGSIYNSTGDLVLNDNTFVSGTLTINSTLSASSYLGLPAHIDTQVTGSSYFFVTNDLAVSGTLSASSYLGLPAHVDTQVTGSDSFFTNTTLDSRGVLTNTTGHLILSSSVGSVVHVSGTLSASSIGFNTDAITEGSTNLYFTDARSLETFGAVTKEPNGFVNQTDSTISFDDGTLTFTIAPVSASFDVYCEGVKYTKSAPESVVIDGTVGLHFIYYHNGALSASHPSPPSNFFTQAAATSIVYWNATANKHIYFADERHGCIMDGATHEYLHFTRGAQFIRGLALDSFTVDGTGNDADNAQMSNDAGRIADEDLFVDIDAQALPANVPVYFLTGSVWNRKESDDYPLIYSGDSTGFTGTGGRPAYNLNTGGVWSLSTVGNNAFYLIHLWATNDHEHSIVSVLGQQTYGTIGEARTAAPTEINNILNLSQLFLEFTPIGTVICETRTTYGNVPKVRFRSTDLGDDYIDFRGAGILPTASPANHGNLSGLGNDDHIQYSLASGTRPFTGNVTISGNLTVSGTLSASSVGFNTDAITEGNTNLYFNTTRTIESVGSVTLDPNGFPNLIDTTVSFDSGSLTFTIAPTGSSYFYYYRGTRIEKTGSDSVVIPDITGKRFIFFDANAVLTSSEIPWKFDEPKVFAALVYWNSSLQDYLLCEERHGMYMDWKTHEYLHSTQGTRYASGLSGAFYDTNTFATTAGVIYDEDIKLSIGATTYARVFWRDGSGQWNFNSASSAYYYEDSGILCYDNNSGTPVQINSNEYVAYWIFATDDVVTPIYSLMGQRKDTSLSDAIANNTFVSLILPDLPSNETRVIYRVILRRNLTSEVVEQIDDYRFNTAADLNFTQYLLLDGSRALTGQVSAPDPTSAPKLATKGYVDALQPMTAIGDIIYGSDDGAPTRLGIGTSNKFLYSDGVTPAWQEITEARIVLADNSTNNVSITKHGFAPILPNNSAQFLNGAGNWTTPAGTTTSYVNQSFTAQTSVNVVHNFGQYPIVQVIDSTGAVLIPKSIVNNTLNDFTITFSIATTGNVLATLGSPQAQSLTSVSTDYSIINTDRIINVTAAGKYITLPVAVSSSGREYHIDNNSNGPIYANVVSSGTIQSEYVQTIPSDCCLVVYSNGATWRIT